MKKHTHGRENLNGEVFMGVKNLRSGHMRRILLLLVAQVCCMVWLGCGQETDDSPDSSDEADASEADMFQDMPHDMPHDMPRDMGDNQSPGVALRFMTYNLRYANSNMDEWERRKGTLITSILNESPDVLGVQEADEPWMDELPDALTGYAYVGVGRDDGVAAGERAAIFFKEDVLRAVESGTFWLSDTPDEPSFGWGANTRRVCTWVLLEHRESGERFMQFNTHFDHESSEARTESVSLMLERLGDVQPIPVVLMGDLNLFERSDQYKRLQNSELTDTKFVAADTMSHGTINWFASNNTRLVIDFIFATQEHFTVDRYQVLTAYTFDDHIPVSDHYPVLVDARLKSSGDL